MTISTDTTTVTYAGNGVTTVFTFPFVPDSAADLVVTYTNTIGISVVLDPSAYTLIINAIPPGGLWGIGGSVTYPIVGSPPVPIITGSFITISRAVPYRQNVSINNQGAFYPAVVEQGLDILELQIQQLNTDYEYALKFPLTDINPPNTLPTAVQRAGGTLTFDTNGQPVVTFPSTGGGGGGGTGFANPRRVSTTGMSTINVVTSDSFAGVSIYQSGSPVTTVQLPNSRGPYPVFDGSLNANSFPITILPPMGFTILGQTSYTLAFAGQSATFWNDGLQFVVS